MKFPSYELNEDVTNRRFESSEALINLLEQNQLRNILWFWWSNILSGG